MINVYYINNLDRGNDIIPETTTLRTFMDNHNMMYGGKNVPYLDGSPVSASDYDATFSDMGITESCKLTLVVKADNA